MGHPTIYRGMGAERSDDIRGYVSPAGGPWCVADDCADAARRHQDFWQGNAPMRAVAPADDEAREACTVCGRSLSGGEPTR